MKEEKNKELFTAIRWTGPPIPEVIGHIEFTEEEKKKTTKE